ncbi:glutathione S-transferas-like protein [Decorospora gaudefroyi]|uniref:Glutathione S-transferas-like protein n=1 Tax=Decorospora gaudefroyi TaxID=184978 RepID=A0A6A5JXB5_9PLEO|nr:glutathione S-transferas-like protein [Decorospora gaudefroyi]
MSSLKPITIYGKGGPNPAKVIMLVKELSIPYEVKLIDFSEVKQPDFLAINPNGRMPAIHDPNTDLTIWESGAIVEYLIEKYDKEQKMSFAPGSKESYLAKQWLFYQVSGQGPYFGQGVWFTKYHSEKIASAQERYWAEIKRVNSVLDGHLKKQEKGVDGPWLVGGKYSYADMAFVPWQFFARQLSDKVDLSEFTEVAAWVEKMMKRESVGPVLENAQSFK